MCPKLSRRKALSITRWQRCHLLRRRPTSSPRCTSTSLWKALQTLISKMESYKSCKLHHCMRKELLGNQIQRSFRREVSAQTSQSSEGHRASGNPAALFSPKHDEQRNQMWSSMFGNANLSNLSGTLLEGNKDHLLSQARSGLANRELHVESLNECIGDLQKRTEAQSIQQLTSQLQQMQEQMNSMESPGDFQDVESNYCGRLSHVSS